MPCAAGCSGPRSQQPKASLSTDGPPLSAPLGIPARVIARPGGDLQIDLHTRVRTNRGCADVDRLEGLSRTKCSIRSVRLLLFQSRRQRLLQPPSKKSTWLAPSAASPGEIRRRLLAAGHVCAVDPSRDRDCRTALRTSSIHVKAAAAVGQPKASAIRPPIQEQPQRRPSFSRGYLSQPKIDKSLRKSKRVVVLEWTEAIGRARRLRRPSATCHALRTYPFRECPSSPVVGLQSEVRGSFSGEGTTEPPFPGGRS